MAYNNLKAECVRRHVKIKDISDILGKSESAVSNNMNGRGDFDISEAVAIKDTFFSDLTLEYLFEKETA